MAHDSFSGDSKIWLPPLPPGDPVQYNVILPKTLIPATADVDELFPLFRITADSLEAKDARRRLKGAVATECQARPLGTLCDRVSIYVVSAEGSGGIEAPVEVRFELRVGDGSGIQTAAEIQHSIDNFEATRGMLASLAPGSSFVTLEIWGAVDLNAVVTAPRPGVKYRLDVNLDLTGWCDPKLVVPTGGPGSVTGTLLFVSL